MSLNPQILTPPARYPISLAEARLQLDIQSQDYDPRLAGLIAAAVTSVETYLGRALITRTYHAFLDNWPLAGQAAGHGPLVGAGYPYGAAASGFGVYTRAIFLPKPPLIAITSVITYDDADTPTTMPPANYYVDAAGFVGRLVLRTTASWPLPARAANGIEITWTAGYGPNPADVPENYRLAVQMMVGAFNEQRGDESAPPPVPPAAQALLTPRVHPI